MLKKTTYKRMLAVSVLSALMGSGSVMAANVETGYTPQMGRLMRLNKLILRWLQRLLQVQ